MKKLIKNGTVLVGKELEPTRTDLLIDGNNIAAMGPGLKCEDAEVIDARDMLITPGLCNAHLHSDENIFKGMTDNMPLELWMLYTYPTLKYGPFSERFIYLRTMLGAIEMIKSGVTLAQDDASEYPASTLPGIGAVMEAYKDLGMRASVTTNLCDKMWKDKIPYIPEVVPKEMLDQYPPAANREELYALLEEMIAKWHEPGGMLNVVLAPVAPQRITDEFFLGMHKLSEKYDLPMHTHILETKLQSITGPLYYNGDSIIEHIEKLGVMSDKLTIIHSVWMSDNDIRIMGDHHVSVVHNPASNLKLGSGIMPFRKLRDAGINVALGTDGMSSNDTQSIFEAMKLTALLHKVTHPDYRQWPTAKEVLTCATQGGARSARRHGHTGYLDVGMRADLVMLDTLTPAFTPLNDPVNHLVYCENGSSIRKVMVDGRVVVEDGRILTVDEKALLEELRSYLPDFWKKYEETKAWADKLFPYVDQIYQRAVPQDTGVNRWSGDQKQWVK